MAPALRKRSANGIASTSTNDSVSEQNQAVGDSCQPSVASGRLKRRASSSGSQTSKDQVAAATEATVQALLQRGHDLYKEDDKKVPSHVRQLYGQIGFVKWTNAYCPVLIINPCEAVLQDNLPSGIYHAWMDKFENALSQQGEKQAHTNRCKKSGISKQETNSGPPSLPLLIYWYGTYYEYSVVAPRHIIFYDEAVRKGYEGIPDFVRHRREHQLPLPYAYELCFLAAPQINVDMDKLPRDRRVILPAIASNTTDTTTSRQQRRNNKISAELEHPSSSVVLNEWHTLSLTEVEGARTKQQVRIHERFVRQREQILRRIHPDVKTTFGKIGFCSDSKQTTLKGKAAHAGPNTSNNKLHPVLILSPFRCPPSPVRAEWFEKYHKWETSAASQNTETAPCLVYWYGAFTCDQSSARPFSFVRLSQIVSYEEGVEQGQDKLAADMSARYQQTEPPRRKKGGKGKKRQGRLSIFQDWLVCGHWEMQQALKIDPGDRWGGMEDFEEDYRDDFDYYRECVTSGGGYSEVGQSDEDDEEINEAPDTHGGHLEKHQEGQLKNDQDDDDDDYEPDPLSPARDSQGVGRGEANKRALDRSVIEIDDDSDDDSAQTVIVLEDTTSCSSSSSSSSCLTPLNSGNEDLTDDEMGAAEVPQRQEPAVPSLQVGEPDTDTAIGPLDPKSLKIDNADTIATSTPAGSKKSSNMKPELAADDDMYHADDELAPRSTSTIKVASKTAAGSNMAAAATPSMVTSPTQTQMKPSSIEDVKKSAISAGFQKQVEENAAADGTLSSVDSETQGQVMSSILDCRRALWDQQEVQSKASFTLESKVSGWNSPGSQATALGLKTPAIECSSATPLLSSKQWTSGTAIEFSTLDSQTASVLKADCSSTEHQQDAVASIAASADVPFLSSKEWAAASTTKCITTSDTPAANYLDPDLADKQRDTMAFPTPSGDVPTATTTANERLEVLRKRKAHQEEALKTMFVEAQAKKQRQ